MTVLALDYLPTWPGLGSCVGQPDLMYPNDSSGSLADARSLCRGCPVLDRCRSWVLGLPYDADPGGVIAGMTLAEREAIQQGVAMKVCCDCKESKPLTAFARWKPHRPSRRPHCKRCDNRRRNTAKGTT